MRSEPRTTDACSFRSLMVSAPACNRNSSSPDPIESPTCGTNSITPFAFSASTKSAPSKCSLRAPEETAPSLKIPAEFLEDCTERKRRAMSPTRRQVHTLTTFAKVRRSTITYPSESSKAVEKKPLAKCSRSQPITTTPYGGSDLSLANKRREVPRGSTDSAP